MKNLLYIITITSLLHAYPNNPPNAKTGAPGEGTCVDCHSSYDLNSGDGNVEILGIPSVVNPGETYTVEVKVSHPTLIRWGFEIAAKRDNQSQGGSFEMTDNINTTSGTSNGITYIKQRSAGTFYNQTESASWFMDWTAPDVYEGEINFYAAGVASNGAYSNYGDDVYTTSTSTTVMESITDVDYDTEIQPIFDTHCTSCHGAASGLSLTSYENAVEGGNHGPLFIPFDPGNSLLVQAIEGTSTDVSPMPAYSPPLSTTQIQLIHTWIAEGGNPSCILGDFNEDTMLNVLDVVQMVNCILSIDCEWDLCVDVNGDGNLNVLDVVTLVNTILGS